MIRFRHIISSILLGVYTLVGTPVMPAVASLLAAVDGSHAVTVRMSENGTSLVLRHSELSRTLAVSDHQTAAGRFVTRLCSHDSTGNHVLDCSDIHAQTSVERNFGKIKKAPPVRINLTECLLLELLTPTSHLAPDLVSSVLAKTDPHVQHQRPTTATVQLLV